MLKLFARLILLDSTVLTAKDRVYFSTEMLIKFSPFAVFLDFINVWFKDNAQFGLFISIAMVINILVGLVRHVKFNTFTFRDFLLKNLEMGFVIVCSYIMLEMLRYTAGSNIAGEAFRVIIQILTLLYPTSKVMKNLFLISSGKFPPEFLMKKLYNFEKSGDLTAFFSTQAPTELENSKLPNIEQLKKED